jgi:hypothetical protein
LRYKLYALHIVLGLALVQYQNCAPSSETLETSLSAEPTAPSLVSGIDQVYVGDISFPQRKIAAFMNENVVVTGVCAQSGSLISWSLRNSQDVVIDRGLAECDLGSFDVVLSDSWENYCDQDLELQAALGAKASSDTLIEAYCD